MSEPHPLSVPSALAPPSLRSPRVLRHKLVLRNTNTKKKKLTQGPNNTSSVIWACFPRNRPPSCLLHSLQILYTIKHLLVFKKTRKYQKKNIPRAQTTRLASLGPVFPALLSLHSLDVLYHKLVSKKHEYKKKITHLGPKRRV